jgi:hypothetical protein
VYFAAFRLIWSPNGVEGWCSPKVVLDFGWWHHEHDMKGLPTGHYFAGRTRRQTVSEERAPRDTVPRGQALSEIERADEAKITRWGMRRAAPQATLPSSIW